MATSRGMDTLQEAKLARGDQGFHETEVSFGGEADLHRHLVDCDKNPGHAHFKAVSKFTVDDLPEGYRDPDIVAYIKAQAELTVRVTSRYTSMRRPDGYSFCNYRGGSFLRTGTGFIQYVYRNEGRSDKPCPCPECRASGAPKKEWAKIKVRTATHVVFDDDEAKNTVAELFYDEEADKKTRLRKVYGDNVRFGAIQGDWCDMRCVSHDLELCDYLKDAWGRWRWLEMKVNEKYGHGWRRNVVGEDQLNSVLGELKQNSRVIDNPQHPELVKECQIVLERSGEAMEESATDGIVRGGASKFEPRLAVIVSHPHGCNKQVSVGQWVERHVIDNSRGWENSVYTYDTATCPGSSGAPVWLLGKVRWGGFFGRHPHSGRPIDGLNVSAMGWDKVS